MVQKNKKILLNIILTLAINSQVRNNNVKKSGQILKFRSCPRSWKFSIFDKILTQPQTSRNGSKQQKNTLEYYFDTCKSEMAMFKKWSKSEISLRTTMMKILNFWQNFYSTSNFQKWFKVTKKTFRIQFWYLQFTHKSEMTMFKKWSKSEIYHRSAVMKILNFWQNLTQPQTSTNSSNEQKNFRISLWYLHFTHKSEMTMFKKWSKSEI